MDTTTAYSLIKAESDLAKMGVRRPALTTAYRKAVAEKRINLASFPTSGTFAAPALVFPYYKRHSRGKREVGFFKIGKIWGVIVGTNIDDAEAELA
jgi:hypothetical protein